MDKYLKEIELKLKPDSIKVGLAGTTRLSFAARGAALDAVKILSEAGYTAQYLDRSEKTNGVDVGTPYTVQVQPRLDNIEAVTTAWEPRGPVGGDSLSKHCREGKDSVYDNIPQAGTYTIRPGLYDTIIRYNFGDSEWGIESMPYDEVEEFINWLREFGLRDFDLLRVSKQKGGISEYNGSRAEEAAWLDSVTI